MNNENLKKHQSSESKIKDISGEKYGMLTAIEWVGFTDKRPRKSIWKCLCECGNYKNIRYDVLIKGKSSCGCKTTRGTKPHGMCGTGVYRSWNAMIKRCTNPKDIHYHAYGERGITVCDEWREAGNFIEWALDNGWKEHLTIERIDVNGNYCPENCCWIPMSEQYKNKQSNHINIKPFEEVE